MIWWEDRVRRADPLPALYDFNVSAVWYAGHYLVLALEADYELGSHAERLAFWDLKSGEIMASPKVYWDENEWQRKKKMHFGALSDWRGAVVESAGDALIIRKSTDVVQAWPALREYAVASER